MNTFSLIFLLAAPSAIPVEIPVAQSTYVTMQESSDLQPDRSVAQQQAQERLENRLVRLLVPARSAPEYEHLRSATRRLLVTSHAVRLDQEIREVPKPYGTHWQHTLRLTVPKQVLEDWSVSLSHELDRLTRCRRFRLALCMGCWGVIVLLGAVADHYTKGYRRIRIGLLMTLTSTIVALAIHLA